MSIFSLYSCVDSRFIRKELKTDNITAYWYYYSYISSNSPDKIEVLNNTTNEAVIVFEGVSVITNLAIINDTIVIQLFKPERGIIIEDNTKDKVFGYYTKIDSSATLDDYKKIPDGKKE